MFVHLLHVKVCDEETNIISLKQKNLIFYINNEHNGLRARSGMSYFVIIVVNTHLSKAVKLSKACVFTHLRCAPFLLICR